MASGETGAVLGAPPRRCLLLAGSFGLERIPARPDPRLERWYEPLHVRDAAGARGRIANQVATGADVVVAPAWLTHRRALLAVGETRQARAWTAAAVAVGRNGVEEGLERRDAVREDAHGEASTGQARDDAPDGDDAGDPGPPRALPRLAGTLPALGGGPELDTGRLLPREAAAARDYVDQAGLLADAGPDLLLVEGQRTFAEIRLATEAAVVTGLPVWLALSGLDADALAPGLVIELAAELRAATAIERTLLPPMARPPSDELPPGWGGLARDADEAAAWLERGTDVIGLLDGATPSRLAPIRAAIDRVELADLERRRVAGDRWWAHVRRAAAMTPGGQALWLGGLPSLPGGARLPDGFEWLMPDRADEPALPEGRYRLVVDPVGGPGAAARVERLLDRGGVAVLRGPVSAHEAARLRVLSVDEDAGPPLTILRRES